MAETVENTANAEIELEGGTYEILRNRLNKYGNDLRKQQELLNVDRKLVFGSIETTLLTTERITTENNCVPVDMIAVGELFIFGYNVHVGLRNDMKIHDVFSVYSFQDNKFQQQSLDLISNQNFIEDFDNLYKYYKETKFSKFAIIGVNLHMVFRIGKSPNDIKTFKWLMKDKTLEYVDNRSDHEFQLPDRHEFKWKKTTRDQHRKGEHPHISIEDKVFVETIEGDLTIKVENNTESGRGIYSEDVESNDQTLDDAEIHYSIVDNIIVLKIKPYLERDFRYIVYNQKIQEARRIDSLAQSCVLLPDGHGLIFANGYYLQTGEYKIFENDVSRMQFEKRIISPNGEDFMYIFFSKDKGSYTLLSYNLIEQKVDTPILCHGYTVFENGSLCYFKADNEPKRHHSVQIWQTPYLSSNFEIAVEQSSYLYKIGNRDLVNAMAECKELLSLIDKEDTYSGLYLDIVKKTTDISDTYYWLDKEETHKLIEPLIGIKTTASTAIDEFEKVRKIKKNTLIETERVATVANNLIIKVKNKHIDSVDDFVHFLAELRSVRGGVVSLKELKYIDLDLVQKLETELEEQSKNLSENCVTFLLTDNSLKPYENKVEKIKASIDEVTKVIDANKFEDELNNTSAELEMLIDIVSNLKIEDATQTARIIDNISAIYSDFNQIRASLRRKRKELLSVEGKAEFNSQIKLISQSVINFLDLCDAPDKTDEYLTKLMVQLEELEGKFSEFDEFIKLISEKREEIYNAFETKKVNLIEIQSKRANTLLQSAERILKAIGNRISVFKTVTEISGYFATDLMIEKARDIVDKLLELGDTVKADDLQSRLKTVREDAVRQLKDKADLFVAGEDIIKFGNFHFNVNTQNLSLTMVSRNNDMYYHLTGTGLFEKVENKEFNQTKAAWQQSIISENDEVYRAEYLAYKIFEDLKDKNKLCEISEKQLAEYAKKFMSQRYNEGYIKGIHDHDAIILLSALSSLNQKADLLHYSSKARACAEIFWKAFINQEAKENFNKELKGLGTILTVFPDVKQFKKIVEDLSTELEKFISRTALFDNDIIEDAAEYLFYEISRGDTFVLDSEAKKLTEAFKAYLNSEVILSKYQNSINSLNSHPDSKYRLIRNWLLAFNGKTGNEQYFTYVDEATVILFIDTIIDKQIIEVSLKDTLENMEGSHSLIVKQKYELNYNAFIIKLRKFINENVPLFENYINLKIKLSKDYEAELRLSEFKPRVLTSFVRNRLIDQVYLPLIGSNLAKQIGAAGEGKRTDLMGMLLLVSPPGYGKTTLMEYIANRLGIIFMKINGPALGHSVTSTDPGQAPNATAREELEKLNLAFEMGDNVMIYVDDIQHCNPEFLQKFISLADGQRKIEGVYKGQPKTYDFRGKKVCIIMAGNPYTESGERFQIPDMLSNRADIYNLGDIIGDTADAFNLSYIENSMTSNPVLAKLAGKSSKDIYTLIHLAEKGNRDGLEFEANHSPEEINEYVSVLKKMLKIRNVISKVNQLYIYSAAQTDAYREEPTFKLQGSYRDMNKLAEKVMPVMNDKELQNMIITYYENEAQTLTSDTEANLLKFKELIEVQTNEDTLRWVNIKKEFLKQQKLRGVGSDNQIGMVLLQMEAINEGLTGIKDVLAK